MHLARSWGTRLHTGMLLALGFAISGCSAEIGGGEEQEELATSHEALGESGCGTIGPDASFTGGADYTSPNTYNRSGCYKGTIVDVASYSATFMGPGDIPGGTFVEWAAGGLSTQASCEAAWLAAYLYTRSGSTWIKSDLKTTNGFWFQNGNLAWCVVPSVSFTDFVAGDDYRFVVSARTAGTSGAATRAVLVQSRRPQSI